MEEKPPSKAGRDVPRARNPRAAFSTPEQPAPPSKPAERAPRRAAKAAPPVTFQPPSDDSGAPESGRRRDTVPNPRKDAPTGNGGEHATMQGGETASAPRKATPRKGAAKTTARATARPAKTPPAKTAAAEAVTDTSAATPVQAAAPAKAAKATPAKKTARKAAAKAAPAKATPTKAGQQEPTQPTAVQSEMTATPAQRRPVAAAKADPVPADERPTKAEESGESGDRAQTPIEPPVPAAAAAPAARPRTQPPTTKPHTEAWAKIVADPGHLPELLALAATQTIGPRAKEWARRTREEYPKATNDALARLAVSQFTRFGSMSSVFAAVAGSYVPIALLGSNAVTYAELILHLAAAHGLDPTDRERAVDLLVLTEVHPTAEAAEVALASAQQPAYEEQAGLTGAVWRLGRMVAAQAAVWTVLGGINRFFPGTTMLGAIITSRSGARNVAARAIRFYGRRGHRGQRP